MTVKPLLIFLCLALAGCGAAPTTPVQPEAQPKQAQKPRLHAGRSRPLPSHYRKVKIVEAAKHDCNIVVETNGQTLQAIGGNVRNSVSKTIVTLSPEGYLQPTSHRPWFLVIENRLN